MVKKKPAAKSGAKPSERAELERILAMPNSGDWADNVAFLRSIGDWVWVAPGRGGGDYLEFPEMSRMIKTFDAIFGELNSSGLFYLIDRTTGDNLLEAIDWARQMGATTTANYLDELANLFPNRQVPTNCDDRVAILNPGNAETEELIRPLDAKYRDAALAEIPVKLRAYVEKNADKLLKEYHQPLREKEGASDDEIVNYSGPVGMYKGMHESRDDSSIKEELDSQRPHPEVGDVFEIRARKKYVYIQMTHRHFYHEYVGQLFRMLPGAHKTPLADDKVQALVAGDQQYFATFSLGWHRKMIVEDPDLYEGKPAIRFVGKMAVPPSAGAFPRGIANVGATRDGRNAWEIWSGGQEADGHHFGALTEELKGLQYLQGALDPIGLVDRAVDRWKPLDEHNCWPEPGQG